uniref:Uncharacterized protein n=1 Tax=Glossina palpalis gambiensis TaxID=67801 RepID=A0A1B0B1I7_9MUSC
NLEEKQEIFTLQQHKEFNKLQVEKLRNNENNNNNNENNLKLITNNQTIIEIDRNKCDVVAEGVNIKITQEIETKKPFKVSEIPSVEIEPSISVTASVFTPLSQLKSLQTDKIIAAISGQQQQQQPTQQSLQKSLNQDMNKGYLTFAEDATELTTEAMKIKIFGCKQLTVYCIAWFFLTKILKKKDDIKFEIWHSHHLKKRRHITLAQQVFSNKMMATLSEKTSVELHITDT